MYRMITMKTNELPDDAIYDTCTYGKSLGEYIKTIVKKSIDSMDAFNNKDIEINEILVDELGDVHITITGDYDE